MGAAITGLL